MPKMLSPDKNEQIPFRPAAPSQRILACLLCQQRKVKCDRTFPCSNCVKQRAECIPATAPRKRRRRFPERELLDRVRTYEDLLRRNNIQFEPMHKDSDPPDLCNENHQDDQPTEGQDVSWSPSSSTKHGSETETKTGHRSSGTHPPTRNLWHAMRDRNQEFDSDEDFLNDCVRERAVRKVWEGMFDNDNHLLLGSSPEGPSDRSVLHPEPVHIFKLWQTYLDNVNPLLKVTHSPSLQGRIIEAASNPSNMEPMLECLMLSIYCVATMSFSEEECKTTLGTPKKDALRRFQDGCRQALLHQRFLKTSDRDCLTAFFLYLVSMRPVTDPQSLSPVLGIAVRIAQRMGIHKEVALAKQSVFEAEMRRRLWWALVFFDTRIGQLAFYDSAILIPTWDCKVPLNVSDCELRPDMKEVPTIQGKGTDAAFAVVRGELGDFVRHAPFHLDFLNPILKPIAKTLPGGGDTSALEELIENNYLRYFDQGNPIHFMATWTARGHFAKCGIIQLYSRGSEGLEPPKREESQRIAAMSYAYRMLECDTKVLASPMCNGYLWFLQFHFPFPAYIHIVQDLRRQPLGQQAEKAWEVMNDNYEARFGNLAIHDNPLIELFSQVMYQAWDARKEALKQSGQPVTPPKIIASIESKMAEKHHPQASLAMSRTEVASDQAMPGTNDVLMPFPMDFVCDNLAPNSSTGWRDFSWMHPMALFGQDPASFDASNLNAGPSAWNTGAFR